MQKSAFLKNISYYFNEKCNAVAEHNGKTFVVTNKKLYCFYKKRVEFSQALPSAECNRICVCDKIYVSAQDKSIYVYSLQGKLESLITVGEHISDLCAYKNAVFGASYHDNIIFKIKNCVLKSKIDVEYLPDCIIFKEKLYCLAHDEFFSYVLMLDEELNVIKQITCLRGGKKIYFDDNFLIFNSFDYQYKITSDLRIKSIKKHRHKPV